MLNLINLKIHPSELMSTNPDVDLQVNCYEYMTGKEQESFHEAMGVAITCVRNAMLRKLKEASEQEDSVYEINEEDIYE